MAYPSGNILPQYVPLSDSWKRNFMSKSSRRRAGGWSPAFCVFTDDDGLFYLMIKLPIHFIIGILYNKKIREKGFIDYRRKRNVQDISDGTGRSSAYY